VVIKGQVGLRIGRGAARLGPLLIESPEHVVIAHGLLVEIHHQEHVVARQKEVVKAKDGAVFQAQVQRAVVGFKMAKVRNEPVDVELAVADAGEVAVAEQVVHAVDVEFAGHERGEQALQVAAAHLKHRGLALHVF
jgi:hypothetical protein